MNRDTAKRLLEKYLPMLTAFAKGKPVEFKDDRSRWMPVGFFNFQDSGNRFELRIKPEPKLRAWNGNTAPVGALIRRKSWVDAGPSQILAASGKGVRFYEFWTDSVAKHFSFEELLDPDFEHSTDWGKTWGPCGVMESAD